MSHYEGCDLLLCTGSPWGLWSGGLGDYGVAVLVSLVTGGYHSSATYSWTTEGEDLDSEVFPVLYTCKRGTYVCKCTFAGMEVKTNFIVYGMYETFCKHFNHVNS